MTTGKNGELTMTKYAPRLELLAEHQTEMSNGGRLYSKTHRIGKGKKC